MNDLQLKRLISKLTGVQLHKEGMAQVAGQGELDALTWHRFRLNQSVNDMQGHAGTIPAGLREKMQYELERWRKTHLAFLPEQSKQAYDSTTMIWYAPDFSFSQEDETFLREQNPQAFLQQGDQPGAADERRDQAMRAVERIKANGVPLWMSPEEWQQYSAGRNDKHQHFNGSDWHFQNTFWAWGGRMIEDGPATSTRVPVLSGGNGFFTPTQLAQWEMDPNRASKVESNRNKGRREAELVVARVPAGDAYGLFYHMLDDGSLKRVEMKSAQGLRYLLVDTIGVSGAMPGNTSYFMNDVSSPNFVRVTPGAKAYVGVQMGDGSVQIHFGNELGNTGYRDWTFKENGQIDKGKMAPPRVFPEWPRQIIYRNGRFEPLQPGDQNANNDLILQLASAGPAANLPEFADALPDMGNAQNVQIGQYIDPNSKGKATNQNVWYLHVREDGALFWAKKVRGAGVGQMHPLTPAQIERLNRHSPGKIGLHCFLQNVPQGRIDIQPADKQRYENDCKMLNSVRRILSRNWEQQRMQREMENRQRQAAGQPPLPKFKKRIVSSEDYHIVYVGPNWLHVSQPQKGVAISRLNAGDRIHDERSMMQDTHRTDQESRQADTWQVHSDEFAPAGPRQEREGFKVAKPMAGRSTAGDAGFSSLEAALKYFYTSCEVDPNQQASAQEVEMAKAALNALHEYMEQGQSVQSQELPEDYSDVVFEDDEENVALPEPGVPVQPPQGQLDQRMRGQTPQQQQPQQPPNNALNLDASSVIKRIKKMG